MRFRALNRIETRQKLTEHMDLAQKHRCVLENTAYQVAY